MKAKVSSFVSGPTAVVILLAFFLPWITLSCDTGLGTDQKVVTGSGMDLANGIETKDTDLAEDLGIFGMADLGETSYTMDDGSTADVDLSGLSENLIDPAPYLWLIPLLACGVGLIAFLRYMQILSSDMAGNLYGVIGMSGLVLHLIKFAQLRSDLSDKDPDKVLNLQYEMGWWLSLIAFVVLIGAALIAWFEQSDAPKPTPIQPIPPAGSYPPPPNS